MHFLADVMPHALHGWWNHFWWWFEIHTGTQNEAGPYYGFFSGFGSDLAEITLVSGVILGASHMLHEQNCHVKGCWRYGPHFYDMDGQHVKLCKKHHPKIGVVTAQQVLDHANGMAVKAA